MFRLLVTPKWLALISLLVAVSVAFAWLGAWQWSRAITTSEGADDPRPEAYQPLSTVHEQGVPVSESADGIPVVVRGEYKFAEELYVPGRLQEGVTGTTEGFWVLTPLEMFQGEMIPVVRGWVSTPSEIASSPSGGVTVKGLLHASESDALREGVSDELGDDEIAVVSSPELLSRWDGELWQGFVVLQSQRPDAPTAAVVPVRQPAPAARHISWQSLAYAVQWWLLAAFALFFFWRMFTLEHESKMVLATRTTEGKTEGTE